MSNYPLSEKILANTHRVENHPPALENYNVYEQDIALRESLKREGGHWAEAQLHTFGANAGSSENIQLGVQANQHKPILHTHDRYGNRIDEIEFHPAYHQLMSIAKEYNGMPWTKPGPGSNVVRAAYGYLHTQFEAGHGCPITMTHACIPTIRKQSNIAEFWEDKITNPHYDPRNIVFSEKKGLSIGMAMTEKQGGSDVRTNSTVAHAITQEGPGKEYELVGHKFFVSAPMCDAFLMLAQTVNNKTLSCFLVPRWRPDGSKNPMQITRIKDKMGNVSNATSEMELRGAFGWMIGEESRGIANILEMVALTRFDCMMGSAAGMRQAVSQINHHCSYRRAFDDKLINQPLMQNVLADLSLEAEAALIQSMRAARWLDEAKHSEHAAKLSRIGTAIGKYWICKRAPAHAYESMECIGGSGTMEDSVMPRLYREAPINTIWEGSGNVQCLDVLRIINSSPDTLDAFLAEISQTKGEHKQFDQHVEKLKNEFTDLSDIVYRARSLVEKMALALQGSLMIQSGNHLVSDAFCEARLGGNSGLVYGMLPKGINCKTIIDRATPKIA